MGIIKYLKKKRKEEDLFIKLHNLENSIYLQICMYTKRADTKYHRGIIDALISVRAQLEKIIDETEVKSDGKW